MLDANEAQLSRYGTVTVHANGSVVVEGFSGDGTTCRDVAALAAAWAIQVLARELHGTLERPGGGRIGIG